MPKQIETKRDTSDAQDNSGSNFFAWVVGVFAGGNDPERERKRALKNISKELMKTRYKFYKPKGSQALPGLAKFFWECYKVTGNAALILQNVERSNTLKSICIEAFLTETQKELLGHFGEDYIREQAKKVDAKQLMHDLKDDLVNFFAGFDSKRVGEINLTYTLILRFLKIVSFDYHFVLKKFDSSLQERNFVQSPKFEAINAEYIVDDLKDFQEVSVVFDHGDEWDHVFDILKSYKGLDPVNREEWTKILGMVHQVNMSGILTLVIQHTSEDPYYRAPLEKTSERIVEPYIEKMRGQVESVIQKIKFERRDAQIDKLCLQVFGTRDVQRTKYYTEKANSQFSKKAGSEYQHTAAINYLKAFLLDYVKKDIRELQELVLVRGKWVTNITSQQISDVYYQILALSDQIISFDESLSEDAELGARLRKAMGRVVERDVSSANALRTLLNEINEKAAKLVVEGSQSLISLGKYLRMIIEDHDRKDHDLLINWKELEGLSEIPLRTRLTEIYKKLYYFIQLMQVFVKGSKSDLAE